MSEDDASNATDSVVSRKGVSAGTRGSFSAFRQKIANEKWSAKGN